ncbi:helix-turn-helix transcriptional regulator [Yinghuangia sp. YIM S09857]|uniref:helix-turn-helix transcriptional regulator n=1 Tax=Yinghuangia sp. YIM S09857 TaxID=3436929 RepID=UPI003F52AE46
MPVRTTRQDLAARRKALGFSQEALAERLRVDRSTICRWERGTADPQPFLRPLLARLLKLSAAQLDAILAAPSPHLAMELVSDTRSLVAVPGAEGKTTAGDLDEMIRRDFMRLATISGTLLALPTVEAVAADFDETGAPRGGTNDPEQLNAHLWHVFALAPSKGAVFPVVREQLAILAAGLRSARTDTAHRRLCALAADLFQLAGEIFFDANRYTDAAYCYSLAASAGREAQAFDLWACALTRHAYISVYEQRFADAAPLLATAALVARRGDDRLSTRHWISAVQAETYAGLGDLDECKRSLDAAEDVHTLRGKVHNDGWLRFDGSRLAEERGTCYLQLARSDLAEQALTTALAQRLSPRRRSGVLIDLAALGTQRRDLDSAIHYGSAAVELARQTNSGYVGRRLQGLSGRLDPYKGDNRTTHLLDAIAALD